MISYSRVSTYNECPYLYRLKYVDKLKTKFDERATNPLCLGTAIHSGIENRSVQAAIDTYTNEYSIWSVNNDVEIAKMETILPVAFKEIPEGTYEYKLLVDDFIGFIDLLVQVDQNTYDLYDFKYSNNADRYMSSGQVHIYKYYYEKVTGNKIRNMYYALVPKCTETLQTMAERQLKESIEQLREQHIKFIPIEYDPQQIVFFEAHKKQMLEAKEFPKRPNKLCWYCDFRRYCKSNGEDTSELKKKIETQEEKVEEVSLW